MAVMVLAPRLSVTCAVQLAVPEPTVRPPLAAAPLIVMEETPLFPKPESLAVPATVMVLVVTVEPVTGLPMVRFGPWLSVGPTTVGSFAVQLPEGQVTVAELVTREAAVGETLTDTVIGG